jgi:hypothetical protein
MDGTLLGQILIVLLALFVIAIFLYAALPMKQKGESH